jgi:hypothetical protein
MMAIGGLAEGGRELSDAEYWIEGWWDATGQGTTSYAKLCSDQLARLRGS